MSFPGKITLLPDPKMNLQQLGKGAKQFSFSFVKSNNEQFISKCTELNGAANLVCAHQLLE
jgi:hypothetical protein